jgi:plasmid maintenance system antidote protein VapI
LGKFFNVDPKWFLNPQAAYDAEQIEDQLSDELKQIVPYAASTRTRRTKTTKEAV